MSKLKSEKYGTGNENEQSCRNRLPFWTSLFYFLFLWDSQYACLYKLLAGQLGNKAYNTILYVAEINLKLPKNISQCVGCPIFICCIYVMNVCHYVSGAHVVGVGQCQHVVNANAVKTQILLMPK